MTFVLIAALIALLVAVSCIAVGAAAARRTSARSNPLEWLMDLRSPSGKRFFATEQAARDLLQALDDLPELSRGRGRRPSA
jgi:hypothetical protein